MNLLLDKEDNLERTLEEVEALRSILGEEMVHCEMSAEIHSNVILNITIKSPSHSTGPHLILTCNLSNEYPSHSPPSFNVHSPYTNNNTIDPSVYQNYTSTFANLWADAQGEVMLYDCIQYLSERLEEWIQNKETNSALESQQLQQEKILKQERKSAKKELLNSLVSRFVHGETLTDRRSVFQAHLARPTSANEIPLLLRSLKSDRKIQAASHNIWAYRVTIGTSLFADNDDDGETAAGKRLALLLDHTGASNVLVVVSRWYGGIHLGPDRFRHINNVARILMVNEGCTKGGTTSTKGGTTSTKSNTNNNEETKKKKSKKEAMFLRAGRNNKNGVPSVIITIRCKPNASTTEILPTTCSDTALNLAVDQPARDGKANAAIISWLSTFFGYHKSEIKLFSGGKQRVKCFEIVGSDQDAMFSKLPF